MTRFLFSLLLLLGSLYICFGQTPATLDLSFDGDGIVVESILAVDVVSKTKIQDDGKIVVAGYSRTTGTNFDISLSRYNTDGGVDSSFSFDGKLTTDIGSQFDYCYDVEIQSGKIIAVGMTYNSTTKNDFLVVRYNSDGSLDNTFGTNGVVKTPISTMGSMNDEARFVLTQNNGKLIVGGTTSMTNNDVVLVRYDQNGNIDNSFGTNGKVIASLGSGHDFGVSAIQQPDSMILVTGYAYNGSHTDMYVMRLDKDGAIDNSFGTNGKVLTDFGTSNEQATEISLQSDGKIIIGGFTYVASDADFAVVRYNTDGTVDNSFGVNGKVVLDFDTGNDLIHSLKTQANDKIVAVGYYKNSNTSNNERLAMIRLNADGTPDTDFDGDGKKTILLSTLGDFRAKDVQIQNDGKLVVLGDWSLGPDDKDIYIVRLYAECAPFFITAPLDTYSCANEDVSFSVEVVPATAYQWQVDNGSGFQNVSNTGIYTGADTNTLQLSNVTSSLDGFKYRCIVKGECGVYDTSEFAQIFIEAATSGTEVVESCSAFTWIDGINYTSDNNSATYTLTNASGCDSIVTLNLTINAATSGTDVITACDNYTWIDGVTYTSSNNTATHVLSNSVGCDSIVTLNLTIKASSTGTDVISSCSNYTWMDGVTYTSSNNTATYVLTNAVGCDSIVTMDLTINSVNNGVTQNGSALSSDQNGATYQWLDCDNNYADISGEVSQTFTPSSTGNYAVLVTANNCTDTSACVSYFTSGVGVALPSEISIYPNPSNSSFTIDIADKKTTHEVRIINVLGEEVHSFSLGQKTTISLALDNGVYFVLIDQSITKIIIQQ